jgi:hypothetical protein
MADSLTDNLELVLPEVGASADTWGTKLNSNFISLDAFFSEAGRFKVAGLEDGVARQLLQTNAAGDGVEWSSDIAVPGTLGVVGNALFSGDYAQLDDADLFVSTAARGILQPNGSRIIAIANGALTVTGTLALSGAATLSSTLAVTSNATVGGTLGVTGAATLSSTLAVTSNATVGGTLGVTGNATIGGTLGVTGVSTLAALNATTGAFSGAVTAASLNLGGATVLDILSATLTWDPGEIATAGGVSQTVTVAGAAVGDVVVVENPWVQDDGSIIVHARVESSNTVVVHARNTDDAQVAEATERTTRVIVFKI